MNSTRMAILAAAGLAGTASVGVVLHGMASAHRTAPVIIAAPPVDPHPTVRVLVAKHDLNVGDRIGPDDMTWQAWPADNLNPAFITDGAPAAAQPSGQLARQVSGAANALKGAMSDPAKGAGAGLIDSVVHERIMANEPMVRAKLVRAGAGGIMAVSLEPGMRAVALPLTAESAAGGFILPGDHVDVLLTRATDAATGPAGAQGATAGHATSTVMRNVKVLAIDQNAGATKSPAVIGATATVECTPQQAEYLVLAKASGSLTLMLRSYADAQGPAQVGQVSASSNDQVVRVFRNATATPVSVTQ
jgi:pilus assembly protein CpaB